MQTVRIEYDPYNQKILYEYLGSDGWVPFSIESKLMKDKYQQAALQGVCDEVLTLICDDYATDKDHKVQIIFCGTEDDYEDLSEAVTQKNNELQGKKTIELKKDNTSFYKSASEASSVINKIFEDLQQYLRVDYNDAEINNILRQYSDAASNTVPICVVGGYSSGKSMFINALIGEDVLPSATDPETAQIYKIIRSNCYRIEFTCKEQRLLFEIDEAENVRFIPGSEDAGLCADWISALTSITGNSKAEIMQKMIAKLNASNRKETSTGNPLPEAYWGKIGDLITVEVPFNCSTLPDDIHFEIYDTPGSDSESNEVHFDILKAVLTKYTNGLPVMVIKDMSSCDEAGLRPLLDFLNDSEVMLDKKNRMILVNKADDSDNEELEGLKDKKDLLALRQGRSCIIPLSAIMALGCKRSNPVDSWKGKKTYRKNRELFSDTTEEDYLSLPQYGVYPKVREESILAAVKKQEDIVKHDSENEDARKELIAQNSGIRAVESEITYYIRNRANYNKCKSAAGYLEQAISRMSEKLTPEYERQREIEEKLKGQRDKAKNKLLQELKNAAKEVAESADQEANNLRDQDIRSQLFNEKNIKDDIAKICADHKPDKDFDDIRKLFSQTINSRIKRYSVSYGKICTEFWEKQAQEMKDALLRVVFDSVDISDTEREILKNCILNTGYKVSEHAFKPTEEQLISPKKFLFFKIGKKIDIGKCTNKANEHSGRACLAITRELKKYYEKSFEEFYKELIEKIQNQMDEFNPKLIRMNQDLCDCSKKIDSLRSTIERFKKEKQEIRKILGQQEQEVVQ